MKNVNFKCHLEFKNAFTTKMAKFLLERDTAKLYRLGIFIETKMSITPAIEFIKKNKWATSDQFYNVTMVYHPTNHKNFQEFIFLYIEKGYDIEAIKFKDDNKWFKSTQLIDLIISGSKLDLNNPWFRWHDLSILFSQDPLEKMKNVHFNILKIKIADITKMKSWIENNKSDDNSASLFHPESWKNVKTLGCNI